MHVDGLISSEDLELILIIIVVALFPVALGAFYVMFL